MGTYKGSKIFNIEAIRDTSSHNSSIFDNRGFTVKTIGICNGLDQSISLQLQGSSEDTFDNMFNIGEPFTVNASTNSYNTTTDYFPYIRVVATCSVAPTTGTLTVYVESVGH